MITSLFAWRKALQFQGRRLWLCFFGLCALSALVWSECSCLLDTRSLRAGILAPFTLKFWLTSLLFFTLIAFFALLTGRLLAGGLLGGAPFLLLGLISSLKFSITGTPLLLSDLALAGRLGNIVGLNAKSLAAPDRDIFLAILGFLLWSLLLWFFSKPLRLPSWRTRVAAALVPLAVLVGVFWLGLDILIMRPLGISTVPQVAQAVATDRCGYPLGFLYTAKRACNPVRPIAREDLIPIAENLAAELPPTAPASEIHPNVILILSESFFDVTELPGVNFSSDPLREFHALQEESVSGTFYTRTLGYGTSDIELEVLTGINTHLAGNESLCTLEPNVISSFPSVPYLLSQVGYRTVMLHTYDDSIYHRSPYMEAIGFQERYFSNHFAAIDPDAAAADDYYSFMQAHISGAFYSDDYLTDLLIDFYEGTNDQPLFAYAISMENHTPYESDKYDQWDFTMTSPLADEAEGLLRSYAQGCANASQALGKLVNYLREVDEPTVVVFFGDHRPGLVLDGTQSVYTELWKAQGLDRDVHDPDGVMELYSTNFLIWSNDPSLLPGEPGQKDLVASSNYLGLSLLDLAGAEKPLYWRALEQLSQTRIIDTVEFSLGRDGSFSPTAPQEGTDADRLRRMGNFVQDVLYGGKYATDRLWQ